MSNFVANEVWFPTASSLIRVILFVGICFSALLYGSLPLLGFESFIKHCLAPGLEFPAICALKNCCRDDVFFARVDIGIFAMKVRAGFSFARASPLSSLRSACVWFNNSCSLFSPVLGCLEWGWDFWRSRIRVFDYNSKVAGWWGGSLLPRIFLLWMFCRY